MFIIELDFVSIKLLAVKVVRYNLTVRFILVEEFGDILVLFIKI